MIQNLKPNITVSPKNTAIFFKIMNEVTDAVVKDVDDFVKSYNYSDCDGMIDYFHVDFIILDVLKIMV